MVQPIKLVEMERKGGVKKGNQPEENHNGHKSEMRSNQVGRAWD